MRRATGRPRVRSFNLCVGQRLSETAASSGARPDRSLIDAGDARLARKLAATIELKHQLHF